MPAECTQTRPARASWPPRLTIARVFHIGTLNAADKGVVYPHSHEGHGLSICLDPDEWERIARLGGLPRWSLTCDDGSFLDAHALGERGRRRIADWGIAQGYVARARALRVRWWDSEDRCEYQSLFGDLAEARDEAALMEGTVRSVVVLEATGRLDERIHMSAGRDCLDQLLGVWVEETTDLDGVWWQDEYRALSAPRGMIVPTRLDRWERCRIDGER